MAAAAAAGGERVLVRLSAVREATRCAICFGILRNTRCVKACMHRFCAGCIEQALLANNNECPACRAHLPSRRSLRADPAYDALVAALYGDVDAHEAAEAAFAQDAARRATESSKQLVDALARQRALSRGGAGGGKDGTQSAAEAYAAAAAARAAQQQQSASPVTPFTRAPRLTDEDDEDEDDGEGTPGEPASEHTPDKAGAGGAAAGGDGFETPASQRRRRAAPAQQDVDPLENLFAAVRARLGPPPPPEVHVLLEPAKGSHAARPSRPWLRCAPGTPVASLASAVEGVDVKLTLAGGRPLPFGATLAELLGSEAPRDGALRVEFSMRVEVGGNKTPTPPKRTPAKAAAGQQPAQAGEKRAASTPTPSKRARKAPFRPSL